MLPSSWIETESVVSAARVPAWRQVTVAETPPNVPPPAAGLASAAAWGSAPTTIPKYSAEFEKWCAEGSAIYAGLQDGSITFDNITTTAAGKGVLPVGTTPRPGQAAG